MPFTALHRLLGLTPGDITDDMIDAAVAEQLAETDDLDWKSKLIPIKDLPGSDYPKDVAAMANRGGGMLVYGVTEAKKRATGRVDVGAYDQTHDAVLVSVAVTAISPPVFGVQATWVGEPGNQVVVVTIPGTTDVPHLIYRGEFFGAPVRNDAMTVWMKERQLEAMYRTRFNERRYSTEALDALYEEAAVNWRNTENAMLIAVAHPRLPGATEKPSREQARDIFMQGLIFGERWAGREGVHPLSSMDIYNPRPGLRRWVAMSTATSDSMLWRDASAAVHHDGSVSMAATVGGHRSGVLGETLKPFEMEGRGIEAALADFMGLVRAVAVDFITGDYEVRVGIEYSGPKKMRMLTVDNFGGRYEESSTPMGRYTPITTTVDAESTTTGFIEQLADLAQDAINQGGLTHLQAIKRPDPDVIDKGGEED